MQKTGLSRVNEDLTILPHWLRQEIPDKAALEQLSFFKRAGVDTVCQQAKCPNWAACFKKKQATFLILGDTCSRNCRFCNVKKRARGDVSPTEGKRPLWEHQTDLQDEPRRVGQAVRLLQLDYVVITSVTRDDLEDGGAEIFVQVIKEIRSISGAIKIEVLIPDFAGKFSALKTVVDAAPDVIGHNLETVPRLYSLVRPLAEYERSLEILKRIKEQKGMFPLQKGNIPFWVVTKSSLILGMGEKEEEVIQVIRDLVGVRCDILILGQYLAPSKEHYPVVEFVSPNKFDYYKEVALSLGIKYVLSGPLVRSSYKAEEAYNTITQDHVS